MQALLEIEKLSINAGEKTLVEELSLSIQPGETLGLVGESGSGKSLTSLAVMGLLPGNLNTSGRVSFQGKDLQRLDQEAYRKLRGPAMAMIFQEPMSALNPSMRCGRQAEEVLMIHAKLSAKARRKKILALFDSVGLPDPERIFRAYPHQLSGGQKQRVMIAAALAGDPKLLIADEPTTALDASVQGEILRLIKNMQEELGLAMLFISHDLGVVQKVADQVLVMQQGKTKEKGPVKAVFENPQDPYTRGLLACRPTADSYEVRLPLVRDFVNNQGEYKEVISPALREERARQIIQQPPMVKVEKLSKEFRSRGGFWGRIKALKAVDEVSFEIYPGESLGLVGESGSGKTTIGRMMVGLEQANAGQIYYGEKNLRETKRSFWRAVNRDIQIIFQDPFASLNPRLKVGEAIAEVMRERGKMKRSEARAEAEKLLAKVGLLADYYDRYPHEFSGGQRQRVGIARALALKPKLLVCDESVSALDVSVQAQILNLLNDLKDEFNFSYLFISHDLNVVKYFCQRILVLKDGKLVESGLTERVYWQPKEEYTEALIAATQEKV